MKYTPLAIPDIVLIEPQVFGDDRGFFMETWREDEFRTSVANYSFVQDNHSKSSQGVLRGLHYQIMQPQGKLVRVLSGTVFDVAVDIRKNSPSFGKWIGATLSLDNKAMLWVPPGFAHGFYVISKEAEFVYKCTDYYAPEHDRGIAFDDTDLAIDWQLPLEILQLSDKDKTHPTLANAKDLFE